MFDAELNLYVVFGFIGVALYLGSYAALQLGYVNGQGGLYALLNLTAASSVLISLIQAFNLSSALIQVFWIFISIIGLIRMYLLTRHIRFSDEERAFIDQAMRNLSKRKARKFLDAGYWIDGESGAVLTREGEPVEHLIYLLEGEAEIISSGRAIAVCEAHSFIGELTAMSGEPATATVRLDRPSRYFCIGVQVLRQRLMKDLEIRANLESCVSQQMLHKLKRSNQALAGNGLVVNR
ncbi:cyclic nucleotide-binding domain-containing protein [Thalassospiraceae bacterium LMO-JJ14]|nr:cyclic nucleotide-binding domain-containing protein [Thalassospiraceae bacterium LMO-JJ14]